MYCTQLSGRGTSLCLLEAYLIEMCNLCMISIRYASRRHSHVPRLQVRLVSISWPFPTLCLLHTRQSLFISSAKQVRSFFIIAAFAVSYPRVEQIKMVRDGSFYGPRVLFYQSVCMRMSLDRPLSLRVIGQNRSGYYKREPIYREQGGGGRIFLGGVHRPQVLVPALWAMGAIPLVQDYQFCCFQITLSFT